MLRCLTKHYDHTLNHLTDDMFVPPNLQQMQMDKDKGIYTKTGTPVTQYKTLFLVDGKTYTCRRETFIIGEPGSGKSTVLAKLVMDWCDINNIYAETDSVGDDSRMSRPNFFNDLTTLKYYKFIFLIILRFSVGEFDITQMIRKQIIDSIYCLGACEKAYILLNEIMKRERCLVLLDGLDELISPKGNYLPALEASYEQCDVLITTRPWTFAESKVSHRNVNTVLLLEGLNNPFDLSRIILSNMVYHIDDLDNKQSEFELYIRKHDLLKLLSIPVMVYGIVQSWAESEETELDDSMCGGYTLLQESLLKNANFKKSVFEQAPFRCFIHTKYIQPNLENVNRLAEAAFLLLFSEVKENSLVFSEQELKSANINVSFALKSGILVTQKASVLRTTLRGFSFIHKSLQEFLAAYYIALDTPQSNAIMNEYLKRHVDAYLDISQVFIFLCGLNMSAANKLSCTLDKHDEDKTAAPGYHPHYKYQDLILSGYREAGANAHTDILLKLSRFYIRSDNIFDVQTIWTNNTPNVLSLKVYVTLEDSKNHVTDRKGFHTSGESAASIKFHLSSCHRMKSLELLGGGIWLMDTESSAKSKLPVWIVLNRADPDRPDHPPVLPSIEHIDLKCFKCSATALSSLLSTLLALDHEVKCELVCCCVISGEVGAVEYLKETRASITTDVNNTLKINVESTGPGLWEALNGQTIKCLSISELETGLMEQDAKALYSSLRSLTQLETLNIDVYDTSPKLCDVFSSLNFKRLTVSRKGI